MHANLLPLALGVAGFIRAVRVVAAATLIMAAFAVGVGLRCAACSWLGSHK